MFRRAIGLILSRPSPPRLSYSACLGHVTQLPAISSLAFSSKRFSSHQAYEDSFDQDELAEARKWRQSFQPDSLPKGETTFARSSGPGGQHVNKTETKAITTWSITQLTSILPKIMHSHLRSSKYYTAQKDCLSLQAQTSRSRTANAEENAAKLWEEIQRIYDGAVPSETSPEKRQKYAQLAKVANRARLQSKKFVSSKKASRRGE